MFTVPVILALLVLTAGIILLQVFLSKRDKKWLGLLLPAIAFIISLIIAISVVAYTNIGIVSRSVSEGGVIVVQEIEDTRSAFGDAVQQVIRAFLLSNIATVMLLAVYAVCREKRKRTLEIGKMQIQDLE